MMRDGWSVSPTTVGVTLGAYAYEQRRRKGNLPQLIFIFLSGAYVDIHCQLQSAL